jgi:hypothetical protein
LILEPAISAGLQIRTTAHLKGADKSRLHDALSAGAKTLRRVRLPPAVDRASGDVNLVHPDGFVNERPVCNLHNFTDVVLAAAGSRQTRFQVAALDTD